MNRSVLVLAGVEARRLVRPGSLALLFLPAGYNSYVSVTAPWFDPLWVHSRFTGLWVVIPAFGLAVQVNRACARADRSGTGELERSLPLPASERVAAHLLSVAAPVGVLTVAVLLGWVAWGRGGIELARGLGSSMSDPTWTPGPAELAQGPLVLALGGMLGVATGSSRRFRLTTRPALAMVVVGGAVTLLGALVSLLTTTPLHATAGQRAVRLLPVVNPVISLGDWSDAPVVGGVATATMAWHDLYLAGLLVLVAWAALSGTGRVARWPGALGAALAAIGGVLQMTTPRPVW